MAEVHDGCVGKGERRDQGFEMMMSVNDVRGLREARQVVDDGHGRTAQLARDIAEDEAEGDRTVAALQQRKRYVSDVGLRPATRAEGIIRQEYGDRSHTEPAGPIRGAVRLRA